MRDSPRRIGDRERLYAEAAQTFGAALGRLARAYERDADQRRDLLQEIHVALWRSLSRFDGRCSLRTWVYRVAHNTAISKTIRPRASAPATFAIDDNADWIDARGGAPVGRASQACLPEEEIDRRRALDRLHGLIRQLRPLDRQIMLLYLEQLDASAIAEITGLSAANVATRVRRIKHLLMQRFHEKGHGQQR